MMSLKKRLIALEKNLTKSDEEISNQAKALLGVPESFNLTVKHLNEIYASAKSSASNYPKNAIRY